MQSVQHISDIPTTSTEQIPKHFTSYYNGSGSTISAGAVVCEDTSVTTYALGSAIKLSVASGTNAAGGGILGAADKDIPTGQWGLVQDGGVDPDAGLDASTANLAMLGPSTTAGRLAVISGTYAATHLVVARHIGGGASSGTSGVVRWLIARC